MAADRPRLVLLTTDAVGGVWHYTLELAEALGTLGVRVALAALGPPADAAQRRAAAALATVSLHEHTGRLEWMSDPWDDVACAGAWLLRLEHELEPDVVHLNQFAFAALPFARPTLLVAHSCVLSWWRAVHGMPAPASWHTYRAVVRRGLAGAGCVAAPTRAMLGALAANYGWGGRSLVIANARSAQRYSPGRKEALIVSAGRLWDDAKNLSALEAVAPGLAWPILVAGSQSAPDGTPRAMHHVHVLGNLTPEALALEYSRAAIYALPARYEPFGLSVLEAALSGCALVLGDIPSLREIWGTAALYVPPDDHDALRACLTRLIEEPHRRAHLARSARVRALDHTPERMARAYLEAYRMAGARRRTRAPQRRFVREDRSCAS